ncbi:unnamed protein product [Mytilus edulis]|uniref:Uncharacterized protein n=1 Tax=Mytilus edulis TaxID=6550 RepID=A0A8S3UY02_MYTED|nr:unnamed protein product [Mytilus edulis]
MSSPESKELMKLFKCSTDVATQVVCAFADSKLLHTYAGNFQKYLEDKKHYFYHQWEKNIPHAVIVHLQDVLFLQDIWKDMETAVSNLTNPYMMPIVKSQIQSMRKYDFDKEEIASLSNKLNTLNERVEELSSRIPTNNNNIIMSIADMEVRFKQTSLENSEDIKQYVSQQTSHRVSQAQQVLSQEIKETTMKERKELEVTILHAIENLAMTVKYDKHVQVLVPEHKFQDNIVHVDSVECPVLWQMATPQGWDVEEVEAKLKDPTFQDGVVKIKFVKKRIFNYDDNSFS